MNCEKGDIGRNCFAEKMQLEERYSSFPQFYIRAKVASVGSTGST